MSNGFRIIFFGTPDFAVPALKELAGSRHRVVAVVTQPDKPRGRGQRLLPTPVKKAAMDLDMDVFQPESVNRTSFYDKMIKMAPDFFAVVAFGQIFSEKLLKIPSKGAINVHASLLPKYRGAAPIQWAMINGEKETGVTTMFMGKKMDAGDILLFLKTTIKPSDTAGTLHDRLADLGAKLLTETLEKLETRKIYPIAQDHTQATYAPMLKKEDSHIDWNQPAEKIELLVRALSPWPGAFTFYGNRRLKIFKTMPVSGEKNAIPGTVLNAFENELRIASAHGGALSILEIQGASGRKMKIEEFLRGNTIPPGIILS